MTKTVSYIGETWVGCSSVLINRNESYIHKIKEGFANAYFTHPFWNYKCGLLYKAHVRALIVGTTFNFIYLLQDAKGKSTFVNG